MAFLFLAVCLSDKLLCCGLSLFLVNSELPHVALSSLHFLSVSQSFTQTFPLSQVPYSQCLSEGACLPFHLCHN